MPRRRDARLRRVGALVGERRPGGQDRAEITHLHGFAETGQFSLAYDLGLRAVLAIAEAMDVLLFQMAVRAHETHGMDRANAQLARNMTMVIAVLVPACAGI
jgi:O-antigen/teichoic acid export membrane protein